eukprot:scaffold634_cov401-Prasinococcus_capsulatus_cf.AAC.10
MFHLRVDVLRHYNAPTRATRPIKSIKWTPSRCRAWTAARQRVARPGGKGGEWGLGLSSRYIEGACGRPGLPESGWGPLPQDRASTEW